MPQNPSGRFSAIIPKKSDELFPIFSFRFMSDGEFSYKNCNGKQLEAFVGKLCRISQLTWRDIHNSSKETNGYEQIKTLASKLPQSLQGEIPMAFRFDGRDGRFVGVRQEEVFHIIWIDTKFKLYTHG